MSNRQPATAGPTQAGGAVSARALEGGRRAANSSAPGGIDPDSRRGTDARERAELALNASESQLAAIIDSVMDAIITIDARHRVVVFNERASIMFGCRRADALGQPLARFMPYGLRMTQHESAGLDAAAAGAMAAAGGTPVPGGGVPVVRTGILTALRADGREFQAEASTSRVQVNGRQLVSIVLRDITERVAAEAQRATLEAQLRESQKMEALGALAGNIAHDFNNIVAAILGNAALARSGMADPALAAAAIDEITKAGQRARDLVQRIMSFSRREPAAFGRQALQPLVDEAVKLLRATVPSGIEISQRLPREPMFVKADATQMSQVLLNLGTNACQAMASHQGRIAISLERRDERIACLKVSDNGSGIGEAALRRIFEPFFTTKQKGEGTGLGLSVVHTIVHAHGGRIEVRSREGEGTTFEIYLPLVDAKAEAGEEGADSQADARATAASAAAAAAAAAVPAHGNIPGKGQHVVYLDDYPAMVFMMKATLQMRGYRVSAFEDSAQALAFVRANPGTVDLVVTDYNMPGHSGLDVAREIRRMRPGLPVIVASGCVTDELREGAAREGVASLFDKPRGIDEMCDMVGEVLGRRAGELQSEGAGA